MRATNIEWEVDEDLEALKRLPTEVDIPNSIIPEDINNDEFIKDYVGDAENYLSDTYGYLVSGFSLENEKLDIELDEKELLSMNYTITIEDEFKNEYADNKFEETFGRFLSDIKDNIDKDIYEKLSIIANAFRYSKINENNIILSLPFDCKPEDILQEGISNLKNPDLCGRYELETLNMLKESFELSSKMIYIMDPYDEYRPLAEAFGATVVNIKEDVDIELD